MILALQIFCFIVAAISALGFIVEGNIGSKMALLVGALLFTGIAVYITMYKA